MNPIDVFYAVQNVPYGSPPAQMAEAVCMMRHQPSSNTAMTPWGSIPQWQAVLLEAQLMALLGRPIG